MNRILLPDIVRSLCAFWIVAVWHIFNYLEPVSWQIYLSPITYGVLASFTFLSGLFCGKKEMNVKKFYINRLLRFMPLLILALVAFRLLHMIDNRTMLLSMVGLSCFIPPQPLTLWFFSMMIIFYFFTPILLYHIDITKKCVPNTKRFVIRSLILYALFIILHFIYPTDYRLLIYYPFYIMGILFPLDKLSSLKAKAPYPIFIGFLLAVMGFTVSRYGGGMMRDFMNFVEGFGSMVCIIYISSLIETNIKNTRLVFVVEFISYISMAVYLFHRVIYKVFMHCMNHLFGIRYLNVIEILVMLLILGVTAYIIQMTYDYGMSKILRPKHS